VWELCACDIMTPNPKVVKTGTLAIDTINLMKVYAINQIIVVDGQDVPIGMIHIHDLLKAGIV